MAALPERSARPRSTRIGDPGDLNIRSEPEAVRLVPRDLAEKHRLLPLALCSDSLMVGTTDPGDVVALDEISRHTRLRVVPVRLWPQQVSIGLDRAYGRPSSDEQDAELGEGPTSLPGQDNLTPATESAPAVQALDQVLRSAVKERVSDIHLEPQASRLIVRFRVDGLMSDFLTLQKEHHPALISRLKIMSHLNIAERRVPQDGRFGFNIGADEFDVRVSIVPTTLGEKAVLRLLPKTQHVLQLDEIGLESASLGIVRGELERAHGMMLVVGPTGSGKTTTLYASLSHIDCLSKNVMTIEDPVEYEFPRVTQMQVHPKVGLTFAAGLRCILRQDPDVLMVGEIRDTETLEMAIRAALTGHMVFSTLHCGDAAETPARLLEMGAEPFLLVSCLTAVVAQRLVRRICPKCKAQWRAPDALYRRLEIDPDAGPLFKGAGCEACRGTGYHGRFPLFEVLAMTDEVREAVLAGQSAAAIRGLIRGQGVRGLREDGLTKALAGDTTVEEVLRVTAWD